MVRVYLPSSAVGLARLAAERALGPPPLEAYAVTSALRAALSDLDEEELEYVATLEAGRASIARLAGDGSVPRRVVVAADVADAALVPAHEAEAGVAGVVVDAVVPLSDIASIHVDDAEAEAAVRAATADSEAEPLLDGVEEHDLSWWTTQELEELVRSLG